MHQRPSGKNGKAQASAPDLVIVLSLLGERREYAEERHALVQDSILRSIVHCRLREQSHVADAHLPSIVLARVKKVDCRAHRRHILHDVIRVEHRQREFIELELREGGRVNVVGQIQNNREDLQQLVGRVVAICTKVSKRGDEWQHGATRCRSALRRD